MSEHFENVTFFKVALHVLCYEESVGVDFLFVVMKLTKLLAIEAKQVDDLKLIWNNFLRSRDGCSVDRECIAREDSTLIG